MLDIVERCNPSKIGRFQVHLILCDCNAATFRQVCHRIFDELAQEVIDVLARPPCYLVVIGILDNPPIHVCPRDPIDGFLDVLDGS